MEADDIGRKNEGDDMRERVSRKGEQKERTCERGDKCDRETKQGKGKRGRK